MKGMHHGSVKVSKCQSVGNILVIFTVVFFTTISLGQTSGGGQVGGSSLLVPISMDDPYNIDKNFITSLVADLYGEQFSFSSSMLWVGEHVDEDPSQPRVLVLTKRVSEGVTNIAIEPDEVLFTELSRHSADWMEFDSSSTFGAYNGSGFAYDFESYGEVVSGWVDNSSSVSRLVVGISYIMRVKITSPTDEVVEFYMERFYPVKRFYNEGQADSYASGIAATAFTVPSEPDPLVELTGGSSQMDCSVYLTQWYKDWCACVNAINANFDRDMRNCVLAPSITDVLRTGGIAAAGTFTGVLTWKKMAKRTLGPWATFGPSVVAFIAGSGVTYGYERAACELKAKSTRDANITKAGNELDRVAGTGQTFTCPSGVY